jgi:hypothetical protein
MDLGVLAYFGCEIVSYHVAASTLLTGYFLWTLSRNVFEFKKLSSLQPLDFEVYDECASERVSEN